MTTSGHVTRLIDSLISPAAVYGTAPYPYANRTSREFKFSGEATKEKYAEKTKDVETNYLNWVKIIKQDADAAL